MQAAEVAGRPHSASDGIKELQRILCSSTGDASTRADSSEWAFDHTLLEAAVTVPPSLCTVLNYTE